MAGKGPRYSEGDARVAIAASLSYAEALRRLGMCPSGAARVILRKYAEDVWRIPTDHFDRYAGLRHAHVAKPLDEILVEHSTYSRGHLKRRLLAEGLKKPVCELCSQGEEWMGRPMSLVLDHVNGIRDDHRLENLRIVCPNCNATLDTHCGRNRPRTVEPRSCVRCGSQFRPRRETQRYCSRACAAGGGRRGELRPHLRRVQRPPFERLLAEVSAVGWSAVGRRYGVSDNAVRKWVRVYEAEAGRAAGSGRDPPASVPGGVPRPRFASGGGA
jgi:hypothetical protein